MYGCMPTELKQAVIRPLLKKPILDYQEFKNFRQISNLTFLSKVIEEAVTLQLVDYIDKRLFSESTMTLLCPLTIKNLLF